MTRVARSLALLVIFAPSVAHAQEDTAPAPVIAPSVEVDDAPPVSAFAAPEPVTLPPTEPSPEPVAIAADVEPVSLDPPSARPLRDLPSARCARSRPVPPERALFPMDPAPIEAPVVASHPWSLEVAFVGGFAWVREGLAADRARPAGLGESSPWQQCDDRGERCTVRVEQEGFGSTLGLRIAGGLEVVDALAVVIALRAQPAAGEGLLAGWLVELGARLETIHEGPLRVSAQLMVGAGQIQSRPPQRDVVGPWARSGIGWVSVSALGSYAIEDRVELVLDVTPRVSFPELLFVLDLGLGVRVRA